MFSEEHLYSIALRRAAFIGDFNFRKLTDALGSAENVWKASRNSLLGIEGIGLKTASDIGNEEHLKFAEKELIFCEKQKIKILLRQRNELPFLLNECDDAPSVLYLMGKTDEEKFPVSIVGTRNLTAYGRQFIYELHQAIQSRSAITVSGLALGADTQVHRESLSAGIPTIAVLAHGFQTLYPSQNRKLAEEILNSGGALLTEFNSSQRPDREHFIQRNRVIAGLSEATIVVESAFGGGSMSTVNFANQYSRDVYALPGKITDRFSQGCNQLIAQHKAAAIATIPDLVHQIFGKTELQQPELFSRKEVPSAILPHQKEIYEAIAASPNIPLDELSEILSLPSYRILPVVLELEIAGLIKTLSGRQFVAI